MRAQLDRLPAFRFELDRHACPFLRSGKLDHAGVSRDPILSRAPDFVDWLAAGLADKVPQRNLQSRDRARASTHVIAQRTGQLLNAERVLADELRLGRLKGSGVHAGPNTRDPLIGLNLDDRPT